MGNKKCLNFHPVVLFENPLDNREEGHCIFNWDFNKKEYTYETCNTCDLYTEKDEVDLLSLKLDQVVYYKNNPVVVKFLEKGLLTDI